MATFKSIMRPEDLPPRGTRESPTLDFKGKLDRLDDGTDRPDYFELAKDIASMASVYGGTLLLGAMGGSQLGKYEALPKKDADEAIEAYQTAQKDWCVPVPPIDPVRIDCPDGDFIVAINIAAVLDRPVAVKVKDAVQDRFGPEAYVFPVRLSTHAIPYSPENLPMLLNPAIRRTAILLESIPLGQRSAVALSWIAYLDQVGKATMATTPMSVLEIDLECNVLRIELRTAKETIPLDDVEAVWKNRDGLWQVRVSGWVDTQTSKYTSAPGRC